MVNINNPKACEKWEDQQGPGLLKLAVSLILLIPWIKALPVPPCAHPSSAQPDGSEEPWLFA